MNTPYLRLLGGAALEDASGAPILGITGRRHRVALLALLATAPSRTLARGKLVGFLWPESSERRARTSLNTCVHNVRGKLGQAALVSVGDDLRLDDGALDCDVWRYAEALEDGDYRSAVELYAGPFMDGFRLKGAPAFEKRVERERNRLRQEYRRALERLAEAAEERGESARAAEWWRKRANEDPYDSRVVLRLVEALVEAGNPTAAARLGRVHQRLVRDELGATPDPELVRRIERLGADGTLDGPVEEEPAGPEVEDARPESLHPSRAASARSVERGTAEGAVAGGRSGRRVLYGALAALVFLSVGILWARMSGGNDSALVSGEVDRSIAVLPFQSLGEERGDDFAAGMHAGLTTRLASVSDLTVVSGTSARRFGTAAEPLREIGQRLGVAWILEGEVQRVGGEVVVNAQLIDARRDRHLWADSYRRELSAENVFDIQEELVRRIVRALNVELSVEEERKVASVPTRSTAAYELYLQAERMDRPGRNEPERIELYGRALELDSAFSEAWAGLADAYSDRVLGGEDGEPWADSARRAARRALSLDPDLAHAHVQLGDVLRVLEGPEASIGAYRDALRLQPGNREAANNLSALLSQRGDVAERASVLDRWIRASPESPDAVGGLIKVNLLLDRTEVADAWRRYARDRDLSLPLLEFDLALFRDADTQGARRLLDEVPEGTDGRLRTRRRAALALFEGDWEEARRRYRELYTGPSRKSSPIFGGFLADRLGLAWALQRLGSDREAREIAASVAEEARDRLEKPLEASGPSQRLAVAHLILGDTSSALKYVEEAVDRGFRGRHALERLPTLAPLRTHSRFERLLVRLDSLLAEERRRVEANGWAEPPNSR